MPQKVNIPVRLPQLNLENEQLEANASIIAQCGEGGFTVNCNVQLRGSSRRRQYKKVREVLKKTSVKEQFLRNGEVPRHTPSDNEDDDVMEWESETDEETRREMDEDSDEDFDQRANPPSQLSKAQVAVILDRHIDDFTKKWTQNTLPRLRRKAYETWMQETQLQAASAARLVAYEAAKESEAKFNKLYIEMLMMEWDNESELLAQTVSAEGLLSNKLKDHWKVTLLRGRQPERPPVSTVVKKPRRPRRRKFVAGDEELLSSSSENEFVDHDVAMEDVPAIESHGEHHSQDTSAYSAWKSVTLQSNPHVIDLTMEDQEPTDMNALPKSESDDAIQKLLASCQDLPRFDSADDIRTISSSRDSAWRAEGDRWRLVVTMIWKVPVQHRVRLFELIRTNANDLWRRSVEFQITNRGSQHNEAAKSAGRDLTRLYLSFLQCTAVRHKAKLELTGRWVARLRSNKNMLFPLFHAFLRRIENYYPTGDEVVVVGVDEDAAEDVGTEGRRRSKVKEVVIDRKALNKRQADVKQAAQLDERSQLLQDRIAATGEMSFNKSRLIINTSKQDHEGLISVERQIGGLIKDHQIKGVRFLWDRIVVNSKSREGCLLAHTMGLGKTMQTVTFLVAITQARESKDPSIASQIPESLQKPCTIVLCPASLVTNWEQEVTFWARSILGRVSVIDSSMKPVSRHAKVAAWSREGGVLILAYSMLRTMLSKATSAQETRIFESPAIVVADEAHYLKNEATAVSQACAKFTTPNRIALTGSPLANNVEEYYSMINWLAPGYLASLSEFRELYSRPIERGLWGTSDEREKRLALQTLHLLTETIGPKINRATIQSCPQLLAELPRKKEYVISVAPTAMQRTLYDIFVDALANARDAAKRTGLKSSISHLSLLSSLSLICNHPILFRDQLLQIEGGQKPADYFPMETISTALSLTKNIKGFGMRLSNKVQILMTILEECKRVGDKVILFSQSIPTLNLLQAILSEHELRVCRLDGSTDVTARQAMVQGFNAGDEDVFLISTTAGGYGLNIQGANRVIIFDFKFNPVHEQQAVGRAYRIGQQKPVFVYHFVTGGSFEDSLHERSVFKRQLAARVVDQAKVVSWSNQEQNWYAEMGEAEYDSTEEYRGQDRVLDHVLSSCQKGEILRVLSTDVFEEEDPTAELTEEERRESREAFERQRLRLQDPVKFSALMAEEYQQHQQAYQAYQEQQAQHAQHLATLEQLSCLPRGDAPLEMPGAEAPTAAVSDSSTELGDVSSKNADAQQDDT